MKVDKTQRGMCWIKPSASEVHAKITHALHYRQRCWLMEEQMILQKQLLSDPVCKVSVGQNQESQSVKVALAREGSPMEIQKQESDNWDAYIGREIQIEPGIEFHGDVTKQPMKSAELYLFDEVIKVTHETVADHKQYRSHCLTMKERQDQHQQQLIIDLTGMDDDVEMGIKNVPVAPKQDEMTFIQSMNACTDCDSFSDWDSILEGDDFPFNDDLMSVVNASTASPYQWSYK